MYRGLRLGRIGDIELVADWSLLIIFFLITFSLAVGMFPAWHPDWTPRISWLTALAAAVLFFTSVTAHELSHALVGRRGGVHVRRITLFAFGGIAHMENEPPSWKVELRMAVPSGMGRYHGVEGFRTFSQVRSVLHSRRFNPAALMYPPYGGPLAKRLLKLMLRE